MDTLNAKVSSWADKLEGNGHRCGCGGVHKTPFLGEYETAGYRVTETLDTRVAPELSYVQTPPKTLRANLAHALHSWLRHQIS